MVQHGVDELGNKRRLSQPKSPTVDSSKADLAKKRNEAEAKKAKAAAAAKKAKGKTKKDGGEDEEDEEKELPKEWETGGIGLYIQGLENSYLGGEVETFKVKATIYDAGGNPFYVKSKELSFETERVEVNYDIKPEKEDGVFVFKTMEVFDDLGDLALNDSVIVFEIIDEEDEKRCWTSTNIVYDDQVFNTIDKNPKQLVYDYQRTRIFCCRLPLTADQKMIERGLVVSYTIEKTSKN